MQSPTLGLIVEREMERRAHVAKPFWELFAKFEHPDGSFEAHHETDKFWEKAEADAALAGTSGPGTVKSVTARKNTRKPPTPYNTTAFTTDASSRLGITPASAMRLAEDLYMDGFISYPRTDNTVYPASLPLRELVTSLVRVKEFSAAAGLLDGELKPTRGKKETTDHPPIYPTQAIHPGALEGPKKRVYELVVRRFLATFSPPMITESTRADIEAGSETYFVRGSVVVDPGYAGIYTYARSSDEEIPALQEGQSLALDGEPWIVDKETQPPSRISQAKLIEMMEERGLGTKATRADIIQKLFDRGYVYSNPPIPTETGIAMYEAFKKYVPAMATPEMTAQLEAEMDRIAAGEMTKDGVVGDSRDAAAQDLDRDRREPRGPGQSRLERDGRGPHPRPLQGLRGSRPQEGGRLAPHAARSSGRKNRANASSAAAAGPSTIPSPATRPSRCPSAATSSSSKNAARSAARRRGSKSSPSAAAPGTSASTTTASRCRR